MITTWVTFPVVRRYQLQHSKAHLLAGNRLACRKTRVVDNKSYHLLWTVAELKKASAVVDVCQTCEAALMPAADRSDGKPRKRKPQPITNPQAPCLRN